MAYKFSFVDNAKYTVDDVNNITKRLVTEGVADYFQDGVPYNLSDFNTAGTLLYTEGVVPESVSTLKVTVSGETITIYPGMAFFSDGAVIEIEEGGHQLTRTLGAVNYVYLKNDLINTNTCYPEVSSEAPTGIYVMLAEIDATGTVTDKRSYARGKLPGYASRAGYLMQIHKTVLMPAGTPINATAEHEVTYDIGNNQYQYLLSVQDGQGDAYRLVSLYRFSDGTYNSFGVFNDSNRETSEEELYLYRDYYRNAKASVALNEGKLTLSIRYYARSDYLGHNFPIRLYLF